MRTFDDTAAPRQGFLPTKPVRALPNLLSGVTAVRTCPECNSNYEDEILHCPEDGLDLSQIEPQDELIGRMIGSYQVVKVLGKGGMGSVYLAQHAVIGWRVAVKFLHPQYATDAKIVDRFFNEAKAVNVIGHDNILKILDLSVTEDNRHYFLMEFLNGKPLQDHVKPNVPMTVEVALPILLQICEALQAAHNHQIIHRDLKPDNVYLITHKGKKNFVKVVDFGIAKLTDSSGASTGKTQTGMVMGTPAYMSPEQAGGMTSLIDGRSDIYSLGVMIYQMLSGKLPFPGSSFGEVLIGHLQLAPPSPREHNPEITEPLEAIILKTLEKKQIDRYQSMQELHDAILAYMVEAGIPNELPVADASEMAGPALSKLPSSPGKVGTRSGQTGAGGNTRNMRGSQPGSNRTSTGKSNPGKSNPGKSNPDATQMMAPPSVVIQAAPSRAGLFIGLGVGLVALLGVGGYIVNDRENKASQEIARVQREAKANEEAAKAAQAAKARQDEEAKAAPIALAINSEPNGASVTATWKGGSATKVTNFVLEVPKMTSVHLTFTKAGYLNYDTEVVADQVKAVNTALVADPKLAVVAKAAAEEKKKAKQKKKDDSALTTDSADSTIPVDFGD